MNCRDARPLVPVYLDGELTEAQAAPLRQHLMSCTGCRGAAQRGTALKGWFVDEGPVEVPAGFAARVARRAFAGDVGELAPSAVETPGRSGHALAAVESSEASAGVMSFVLQLTSIAAAVLVALAIGMRSVGMPATDDLHADDFVLDVALERLDALNAAELAADGASAEQGKPTEPTEQKEPGPGGVEGPSR